MPDSGWDISADDKDVVVEIVHENAIINSKIEVLFITIAVLNIFYDCMNL